MVHQILPEARILPDLCAAEHRIGRQCQGAHKHHPAHEGAERVTGSMIVSEPT